MQGAIQSPNPSVSGGASGAAKEGDVSVMCNVSTYLFMCFVLRVRLVAWCHPGNPGTHW